MLAKLFPKSNAVTDGASPKVTVPAAVLFAVGVALIIIGATVKGTETLIGIGGALVASSGITAGLGAAQGPGQVIVTQPATVGPASDDLLPEDVRARIDSEAGYAVIELAIGVVVLLILVFVLLRIAG